MRERSEKNKAQTTLEETRVDTRKQRRKLSQKKKEPQLARSTKWTPDKQQTQKIQTTVPRRRESASEIKDARSKLLSL